MKFGSDKISDFHFKILWSGDVVTITDYNSTNGVFVNGTKIEKGSSVVLEDGDKIKISKKIKFVIHITDEKEDSAKEIDASKITEKP